MSLRNYLVTQGHTWILNESVSLQSHAIAVARAVGLPFDLKRLKVGGPLRYLPASLQVYLSPARFLASVASSDDLSFYLEPQTTMLFGDAKDSVVKLIAAVKQT